ncbi:MAG: hypothetical protein ACOX2O_10735 [Bdellovibrionota bacterium]|jgi:hypothetical protein
MKPLMIIFTSLLLLVPFATLKAESKTPPEPQKNTSSTSSKTPLQEEMIPILPGENVKITDSEGKERSMRVWTTVRPADKNTTAEPPRDTYSQRHKDINVIVDRTERRHRHNHTDDRTLPKR